VEPPFGLVIAVSCTESHCAVEGNARELEGHGASVVSQLAAERCNLRKRTDKRLASTQLVRGRSAEEQFAVAVSYGAMSRAAALLTTCSNSRGADLSG
jgi:hypothetical protein